MRSFTDSEGLGWEATVVEEEGPDYKGRFLLAMRPSGSGPTQTLTLDDVRWNSERTARRTLATMSEVELRRRLRSARGRAAPVTL